MKLNILLHSTNYPLASLSGLNPEITSITEKSNTVTKGSLFCCIKGLHLDGHNFIREAVEKGAVAILADTLPDELPEGIALIKADNSRIALCHIASAFTGHAHKMMKLIGITGTNGKTSCTYFLDHVLRRFGKRSAIIGTTGVIFMGKDQNIKISTATTPDTIELHNAFAMLLAQGCEWVVMEATSHAFWLNKLIGIQFEAGIFTNLTQDHLNDHGSMEAYGREKAKLYNQSKISVVNADDGYFTEILPKPYITYSIDRESDYQAVDIGYKPEGSDFACRNKGEEVGFSTLVPGRFSVYNALAIIACSAELLIPVDIIRDALADFPGVPGRIQSIPNTKGIAIFVDYAHSEDGLVNILQSVRMVTKNKLITVFGCGGDRDTTKRKPMGNAAGRLSDFVVITSDNPRNENPNDILLMIEPGVKETECPYIMLADREEAIKYALSLAKPGDSVVIAGKGHENYQEFENKLRIHFDDAEMARKYLS